MNLAFSAEQNLLRETVARFCKSKLPMKVVRQLCEEPAGISDELWRDIADQSWLGVLVPEEQGGLGLGMIELGIILEELGRALCPGPYFSTAALGAPALSLGATQTLQAELLPLVCAGKKRVTLGLLEEGAELGPAHVHATARKRGEGYVLSGTKFFVPDLAAADYAVISARDPGTADREDGTTLFLVDLRAGGVSVKENHLTDATSRSGQLVLDDVTVDRNAVLGTPGQGFALCERLLQIANVGIAAGSVAAAEQVLQQVVAYARERTQFGVPVGSFQAVKHPLANLFAEIESARSAYHYAAWAVAAGSKDVRSAVAIARLTCTQAYRNASLVSHQAHGGIAFTWEYDLHFHIKRAKHNEYFLGMAPDYEEVIAREALGI